MADVHFEPFIQLAGLTHDDALIAWGGFFFRPEGDRWRIVEDPELAGTVEPGRRGTIGRRSRPYGRAEVEVREAGRDEVVARAGTSESNHVWLRGLRPDTGYRYRILVDGELWADGERRDWVSGEGDLVDLRPDGRTYDNRFRTFPSPDTVAPLTFAVLGDYGVGLQSSSAAQQLRSDVPSNAPSRHEASGCSSRPATTSISASTTPSRGPESTTTTGTSATTSPTATS